MTDPVVLLAAMLSHDTVHLGDVAKLRFKHRSRDCGKALLAASTLVAYFSPQGDWIMFETMTSEIVIASSIIGACVLVVAGSSYMLRIKKPKAPIVDVDAAVRDAPYHRLQNVLTVADS
ncbi:hypothetical protein [Leisingera aquaemixtae]|nr:hypothetical protein [Leisingera aquaemixtae]